VQSAHLSNQFVARPKEEVIRVAQDDSGVELARQISLHHAFDGRLGSHRHEHRGFYDAVGGMD
jgi:hypothetical protein